MMTFYTTRHALFFHTRSVVKVVAVIFVSALYTRYHGSPVQGI